MSDRSLRSLLLAAAVVVGLVGSAHAGFPPTRRCALLKLRISRSLAQDLLTCDIAAADEPNGPNARCVANALGRFEAAYSDIEARRPCLDTAAASDVEAEVTTAVDALAAALRPQPLAPSRCAEAMLRLTRTYLTLLSTANVRNTRHPNPPRLEASLAQAEALLHDGFTQVSALPDCPVTADEALINDTLVDLETWWLATLFPQCGDGMVGGTEDCDGDDDAACPGLCTDTCTCDAAS